MTQQMLADRLGKSKSWVDKVERGVHALDRFSVIQDLAGVLRVDPAVLLGREAAPRAPATRVDGVEAVRVALARYDFPSGGPCPGSAFPLVELRRRVGHAWLTYQHAQYPQLLRLLPELLDAARRAHRQQSVGGAEPLVQVYRVTSAVLVKLGAGESAWLAADRAVAVAAGDPLLTAVAALPLGPALRALGRHRSAVTAMVTAARAAPSGALSVQGTLLVQAALAAAGCRDPGGVRVLLDRAGEIARRVGEGRDEEWTNFGPIVVGLARVAAAVDLGDAGEAVTRHEEAVGLGCWRGLPAECRAAHLIEAARAYLLVGDVTTAGRALVDADRIAPAEVRSRPFGRTAVGEVVRGGPATGAFAHLATTLGVA
ncbi:helix-turn-helix domain-containing protein [Micromonospora sp. SH-82]|uniref:helix-turn-helix domain-containing protein n=1 Tax=Micromonospora sp. SH-82 TaxID=3132938 RepID=UPI003EBB06F4